MLIDDIRRNGYRRTALVFLVRVPILFPFWLLKQLGDLAEVAGERIARRLPGLDG